MPSRFATLRRLYLPAGFPPAAGGGGDFTRDHAMAMPLPSAAES